MKGKSLLCFDWRLNTSSHRIFLLLGYWMVTDEQVKRAVNHGCAFLHSAVFTWTNLLVVVSELCGSEQDALDLVPLITNVVLEEHHLIVGVVVIVDPGVIPINSRGEKQRMHLRDSFLADQLDPIYVAYNMWALQVDRPLLLLFSTIIGVTGWHEPTCADTQPCVTPAYLGHCMPVIGFGIFHCGFIYW